MRDEFTAGTKETMAKRVGYRCSNPNCRTLTCGPSDVEDKSISIGVAAHVTAASPGGKRYDSSLTAKQRKNISNGIWLCESCAKLIDTDEQRFPIEILKRWKEVSEQAASFDVENKTYDEIEKIVQNVSVVSINQSGGQTAQTIVNKAPVRRDISRDCSAISKILRRHAPEQYEMNLSSGDPEAEALAKQIDELLSQAGWTQTGFIYNLAGSYKSGVEIAIASPTLGFSELLLQFRDTAQLDVRGTKHDNIPRNKIIVGPNPDSYVDV